MSDDTKSAGGLAEAVLARFEQKGQRDLREDEVMGDDGLILCRVCKKPRQCRVRIFDRETVVSCMCKCQQEERLREEQRRRDEEQRQRIRQLKANGIQEKHLLDWHFGVAQDSREIRMAHKYVDSWKEVRAKNLGLLLWGDVGTGKSFVAACIANALLEQGVPVLMTNFSKILNQMGGMYSDERYQYIASFSSFPLLIIDDLGIERNTDYALEQVYAVVDERYKAGLPVIITTNLSIGELKDPLDVGHARIYSRILEMCTPVHVDGIDRRKSIGRDKQSTMKEVLEL